MVNEIKNYSCCLIGHRKVGEIEKVTEKLKSTLVNLIEKENVTTFLFGANGEFNDLCYKIVNELKSNYKLKTIFYSRRDEYAFTYEEKENYSYKSKKPFPYKCFDEIVENEKVHNAYFKQSYVLRNKLIIENSDYCIFYYKENYNLGFNRNSGTKIAVEFAKELNKNIIII